MFNYTQLFNKRKYATLVGLQFCSIKKKRPNLTGSSVRQLSPSYSPNPISNNRTWAASSLFLSWDTQIKQKEHTYSLTEKDRDLHILLVWARATSQSLNQRVKGFEHSLFVRLNTPIFRWIKYQNWTICIGKTEAKKEK
jgi:hypothetical protein